MATALAKMGERRLYALFNAGMIVMFIAVLIFTGSWLIDLVAFAVLWNVISFRRISDTRLWWLHLAPYTSALGMSLLFWWLAESEGNGPWVIGYVPTPWWHYVLQFIGLPLIAAWPLATSTLSVVPPRAG